MSFALRAISTAKRALRLHRTFADAAPKETTVFSWGKGEDGQLGRAVTEDRLPTPIDALNGKKVQMVSAGYGHSVFVTANGEIYSCGKNAAGELGRGAVSQSESVPAAVDGLKDVKIKQVEAGGQHTLALTADGNVYSWGFGGNFMSAGALGHGDKDTVLAPKKVADIGNVTAIAAGESHSLAVTREGHVYSWGQGGMGRLGHGDSANVLAPKLVEWITREGKAVSVSAGKNFSAALLEDGSVYMWGSDAYKQLGNADGAAYDAYQEIPVKVATLHGAKGARIACGQKHTALLDQSGNVWVWGSVGYFLPAKVEGLKGKNVIDIACGLDTVFALTKSGEVYSFTTTKLTDLLRSRVPLGHNERTHNEPVQVKLPGKAVSLSAGLTHALAVAETA